MILPAPSDTFLLVRRARAHPDLKWFPRGWVIVTRPLESLIPQGWSLGPATDRQIKHYTYHVSDHWPRPTRRHMSAVFNIWKSDFPRDARWRVVTYTPGSNTLVTLKDQRS